MTKPSTRRLSEVARHVIIPSGIVSTGWPAVERQCREFGDEFDEWQRGAGQLILAKRADGGYAATVGGVTISIPRQVAKTFLVGRIVVALCVLFPGLKVLWTAHRTRTATNTFRSLQVYVKRKEVRGHLAAGRNEGIRTANGEQEIAFANGSIIMFGAREQGFGRGFDEVDVEVFDEAQILTVKALEDMVAATNQSRHPHGALLFYMGTPPRPTDPGEAFTMKRAEALAFKPEDAEFGDPVVGEDGVYIECSADPDADLDDRKQWAKANPSYPHRTPERSMLRLRKNLPGDDSWRREALGIWDLAKDRPQPAIDLVRWALLEVPEAPEGGKVAYGVKFSPDGLTVALSAAVKPEAGPIHVEGIRQASMVDGMRWLVDWLVARRKTVVIDGKAGAGALADALRAERFPAHRIIRPNTDEVVAAHAGFVQAVVDATMTHLDDEAMNESARVAMRRPIGKTGGWGFAPYDDGDVTLIESAVMAHFGASQQKTRSGREAVVM